MGALAVTGIAAGAIGVPVAAQDEAPSCGTEPVTMLAYIETNFPFVKDLTDEFSRQFPNVTWEIREDQFTNLMTNTPRLMSGDNPPDLVRLPSMVTLMQAGLLLNLDPYYEAFGWDTWPASVMAPQRVAESGRPRGEGPLWASGFNVPITGVYYNKRLAEQIGMTEPPATLEALEGYLAAAKEAGLQPIMQWNDSASGAGLVFPLQNLMASVGETGPINDWIYQKEGATIDTPSNLEAAQHLDAWIKAGYFPEDVNAIGYAQAAQRFAGGEGVFTFNGTWENPTYDGSPDDVGFFLFPPATEGGMHGSMGVPVTFGISAGAKNPDCAAFFLDWVGTNPEARAINVTKSGSAPMGPADLPIPPAAEGSITNDTLAAAGVVAAENGNMDFIANATGTIFPNGWTPEVQNMVGGQQTPEGLLQTVQAVYEEELAQ
jgi:raffinose/stachyose/melibiose transport system substrate-binding protein